MKKLFITALFFILLSTNVEADFTYMEKPGFYSLESPVTCLVGKNAYGANRSTRCPISGSTKYYHTPVITDEGRTKVLKERRQINGRCRSGVCFDNDDNYMGRIESEDLVFYIVRGYYIYQESENSDILTYRHGTGLMADTFRRWAYGGEKSQKQDMATQIENLQEKIDNYRKPVADFTPISEVHYVRCVEYKGSCDFNGLIVTIEEMGSMTGVADVDNEIGINHICKGPACKLMNGDFIGLNTFYYDGE